MYTNGNEIITEWEIDNDTIASKVANSLRGFDTYLNGSNHYNGDARRSPTGTDARYIWEVINAGAQNASSYACLYMDLHIWLNDASFNDPYAEYWVGDSTISYPFCTINQRVAYPGWNNRSSAKNTSVRPGYFFINNVSVTPGSTSGYYTGADCIRLETSTFTDGTCAVVV